jgi:hypothetical protein
VKHDEPVDDGKLGIDHHRVGLEVSCEGHAVVTLRGGDDLESLLPSDFDRLGRDLLVTLHDDQHAIAGLHVVAIITELVIAEAFGALDVNGLERRDVRERVDVDGTDREQLRRGLDDGPAVGRELRGSDVLSRQVQRERAALVHFALGTDLATEQPGDLPADRQA